MFFNPRSILVGATALFFSGVVTAADCGSGPWDGGLIVGGQKGGEWCHTKYDQGIIIKGIEVWASKKAVRAVQFYYSDGSNSGMVGTLDDVNEHQRMDWDPAKDRVDQMKTWGNGDGKYLGRVYLHLSSGAELNVGKDTDGQDVFETNVGTGIMLGAWGRSGDVIDAMGIRYLRSRISKMAYENVKFSDNVDDLNERMEGLNTMMIDYASHKNNQDNATVDFSFSKKQVRMVTKTYTQSAATTFGMSQAIEISGELLGIGAKSTTTLNFETSLTDTTANAEADTTDITYSTSTTVQPGSSVYCRAVAMSGVYQGKYEADVKIYLEDGSDYSFKQGGTLDQVTWSQASSECQNDPFEDDMPTAEAPLEIEDLTKRAIKFSA